MKTYDELYNELHNKLEAELTLSHKEQVEAEEPHLSVFLDAVMPIRTKYESMRKALWDEFNKNVKELEVVRNSEESVRKAMNLLIENGYAVKKKK